MKRLHLVLIGGLCLSSPMAFGQKKEMAELQRDVLLLQDEMRASMKDQNEKIASLEALIKTAIDQVNETKSAVATLNANLKNSVESGLRPVTAVGSRLDTMADDNRAIRATVEEMGDKIGKLSAQLADLNNAIRTMQAPPAPPGAGPSAGVGGAAGAPPPGVTASGLWQDANRDRTAGNYDIALKEYTDYLTYFADTDLAPNAQYYIGDIYYNQKEYEKAVQAFDSVMERYPKNAKTEDARYMKGRALVRLGQRTAGADVFREIIANAPDSDAARKAKTDLKSLGLSTPATTKGRKR